MALTNVKIFLQAAQPLIIEGTIIEETDWCYLLIDKQDQEYLIPFDSILFIQSAEPKGKILTPSLYDKFEIKPK